MNTKRIIGLALAVWALAVFVIPVSASDGTDDPSVYFRPAVRFGTDDRTLFIMDLLVPLYRNDRDILFFNTKFTSDDQDGFETNLGIGYRRLLFGDRVILGGNVFYDYRRTGWGTEWNQIGVGAEAMAEFNRYVALTGRFNYYFPLTDPRVTFTGYGGGGAGTGYFFRTGGIWTAGGGGGGQEIEESPEGFDGEVGFRVPIVSDYVETWVYIGGYHYQGKHVGTIDGVSTRVELIPTDFVRLGYEFRDDGTTHGEHHGEVTFEVPFSVEKLFAGKNPFEGLGSRLLGSRSLNDRMVEPVRRDVDIRVVHGDPGGTGGPGGDEMVEGVVFVSEDGDDTTGDGSFENPFKSIGRAADAIGSGGVYAGITTIHIINDSDTETAGGGTADLASLMIWGSGMPHPIYGTITNQMSGYPTVSGELILFGGTVDVLGTTYTGTNGITVNGANANIHHNYFSGNTWGINVAGGLASITDNDITCNYTTGAPIAGIIVSGGSISTISRNAITAGGAVTLYGISFNGAPSISGTVISENTITLSYDGAGTLAAGIYFSGADTTITGARIMSNTITITAPDTGSAHGIGSLLSAGDLGLEIGGNTVTVAGGPVGVSGIYFRTGGSSSITADVHDNVVTVSGAGDAYGIGLGAGGNIYARITGNDLSGGITGAGTSDGVYGISLVTESHPSTETYDIAGIGGNGLLISGNNLGGAGIRATGTGGYACGIDIYSGAGNLYALSSNGGGITGNTIVANASDLSGTDTGWADGIVAETRDDLAVTITGGSITSNGMGAWGIGLVSDLEDIDAEISVPTITATGTYTAGTGYDATGIFLRSPSGTIDMTVTGTNITALGTTNTRARGINANGYGGITALISGGSITSTGRRAEGIYLGTTGTGSIVDASISNLTLNITGTNTTGSGNDTYATGIFLSAGSGNINANLSGNDVAVSMTSGYTARGIYVTTPGDIAAIISGGSINSTGGRAFGILLESTGTGGDVDADISVPAILVTATGNGLEALGIKLSTTSGNIDADIHGLNGTVFPGVTGMKVTGTYGYARGISIESGGGITGGIYGNSSSNRNTITVEGMLGGSNYPTGVYLRAAVDVGLQGDPFEMYYNDLTVTNISPTMREAFGFAINYGSSTNHDVYARIYNNTITVTGGNGSFGYGAIGGYIRAANLIGYNGSTVSAPTIISGNTLNLTSNVPALGFYIYRTNAVNPGNGNYVDFNNGAYGGANTVTGSSGLYNNASFSMGHPGYWCNFYWGTSGTSGSGQDYIHF